MDEELLLNGSAETSQVPSSHVEFQNAEAGPSTPALSKNAQKRAARLAKQEADKPMKRAMERERRKARTAQLREGYNNGTLSAEELAIVETRKAKESLRRSTKKRFNTSGDIDLRDHGDGENGTNSPRRKKGPRAPWEGVVLIDMGFDDLMLDNEIKSMASQISYCYSSNRQTKIPVRNVIHTSASHESSPRLWPPLQKAPCEKWVGCHWYGGHLEDYVKAFGSADGKEGAAGAGSLPGGISSATHKLVYLSADAEEELETLKEDEVYIIGGIVDHNRYKNLCQTKAEKLGIRTARLPIGVYIANLPTRKVLTVNQVFQILTEYIDKRDWKEAFETVIPMRKFSEKGRRKKKKDAMANEGKGGEGAEEAEESGDEDGADQAEESEGAEETDAAFESGEVHRSEAQPAEATVQEPTDEVTGAADSATPAMPVSLA